MKWLHKNIWLTNISLIGIFIAFDQWTKYLAVTKLRDTGGIDLVEGIFRLQYLENRGAAFGMMQGRFEFFYLVTPIIVLFVCMGLRALPREVRYVPLNYTGVLLVSGAIGNYIDRVSLKYVVDFLYFEMIDFPIFNVADIYVCVATALFVVLLLFYYSEEELDSIQVFRKRGN